MCKDRDEGPRIVLPEAMVDDVIEWHHIVLSHPGIIRMEQTIGKLFYVPRLRASIEVYAKRCDSCQRNKANPTGVAEVLPRDDVRYSFEEAAVDCVGPWKIKVGEEDVKFNALTIIDTATDLTELTQIVNKTSAHIAMKFENEWLSRHPKLTRVIFDNGG